MARKPRLGPASMRYLKEREEAEYARGCEDGSRNAKQHAEQILERNRQTTAAILAEIGKFNAGNNALLEEIARRANLPLPRKKPWWRGGGFGRAKDVMEDES